MIDVLLIIILFNNYITKSIIIFQLWNPALKFELVVGPPMFVMKILITVFTGVGVAIWVLEIVSILSMILALNQK